MWTRELKNIIKNNLKIKVYFKTYKEKKIKGNQELARN